MNDVLKGCVCFWPPCWPLCSPVLEHQPSCRRAGQARDPGTLRRAQEGGATPLHHRFAELPLNHLGYILRYRDVRARAAGAAPRGTLRAC